MVWEPDVDGKACCARVLVFGCDMLAAVSRVMQALWDMLISRVLWEVV
jgi:hypothetical protein